MVEGVTVTSESGSTSFVPCIPGKTSDGYHTFDELYEHRHLLFLALIVSLGGQHGYTTDKMWKSLYHDDGSSMEGWFIAGIEFETGTITYHLPDRLWPNCHAPELPKAPKWDGHTSDDVLHRLMDWMCIQEG